MAMGNENICVKLKSGNIRTCKVRLVWPHFFKAVVPKGSEDKQKPKFQAALLVPAKSNIDLLRETVKEAAVAKFGPNVKKLKSPFKDTADVDRLEEFGDEFPVLLNVSRNESVGRPQVVTASKVVISEDRVDEVYGGRWAYVTVNAFAWDHPTGGKGVSLGLNNVQLLEHDEHIGGGVISAEDEFESVDGVGGEDGGDASELFG